MGDDNLEHDAAGAAGPDGGRAPTAAPSLAGLDALRGAAALAVVVFHLEPLVALHGGDIPAAELGEVGVNVFFVLSGYLIATSVLAPRTFDVRSYLVRRAARILPMYLASIALIVVFVDSTFLFTRAGLVDVGLHVLLVHGLSRDHMTSLSGVFWTLSFEWLFYLTMAAVAPLYRRGRAGWGVAVAFVAAGLAWRATVVATASFADLGFLARTYPAWLDVFGLGLLLALVVRTDLWARWRDRLAVQAGLAATAAVVGLASLQVYRLNPPTLTSLKYWQSDTIVTFWPTAFALASTLAVAALVAADRWAAPVARWSGLAWVGGVSYSLYLLHPLVIDSLGRGWRETGAAGPPLVLGAIVVVVAVAVSAATYRWVEAPAMGWARARTSAARTRPTAAP